MSNVVPIVVIVVTSNSTVTSNV